MGINIYVYVLDVNKVKRNGIIVKGYLLLKLK